MVVHVTIVGTGDHAHGLAHLFSINNSQKSRYHLKVTKPGLESGGLFHDTGVPLVSLDDGLSIAEIVILAIPSYALSSFVAEHLEKLNEKILVDVTNSNVRGEDLHSILAVTNIPWVKAFNDFGAVDVLLERPYGKIKIPSKMCSRYPEAVDAVRNFADTSLGMDVKLVPYEQFSEIARHQNTLGEPWMTSAFVMLVLFMLTEAYALIRYNVHKGYAWFHLPLQVTNKAVCWTAITGFALSQLPGVLARIDKCLHRDSLRQKPKWIVSFLQMRKHLGLLSLWFLVLHIMMSMILFSPAYYGNFFEYPKAVNSKMNAIGETSFLFATLGTALYFILGVCSLPSVSVQMTNRQWQFVYGPLAWIALAFGTLHVLIMGVKGWDDQEKWPGNLPPITLTSTVIPLFVMFLKLLQMVLVRYILPKPMMVKKIGLIRKDTDIEETIVFDYSCSDNKNTEGTDGSIEETPAQRRFGI